jgi:hypothetical protein
MQYERYYAGDPFRLVASNYTSYAYKHECEKLVEAALALAGLPRPGVRASLPAGLGMAERFVLIQAERRPKRSRRPNDEPFARPQRSGRRCLRRFAWRISRPWSIPVSSIAPVHSPSANWRDGWRPS